MPGEGAAGDEPGVAAATSGVGEREGGCHLSRGLGCQRRCSRAGHQRGGEQHATCRDTRAPPARRRYAVTTHVSHLAQARSPLPTDAGRRSTRGFAGSDTKCGCRRLKRVKGA